MSEPETEGEALLEGVPGTGLWGLKARAEEDARPDGLFRDPLAVTWFQRLEPWFGGGIARWYSPMLQQAIALRTHILDQAVRDHLARCPQACVVELGAGFSTRFSRLQPNCSWYELDLPEVIELRASLGEPAQPNHWYLAESLFAEDWLEPLLERPARELLLLAEGLLMYFPRNRVEDLFRRLNQALPGALIAFDVLGGWNLDAAREPGEEAAAPVYWGVDRLEEVYDLFGLSPAGDLTLPAQLRHNPLYRRRIRPLSRWLLRQSWLTRRMGGTVLARLGTPGPVA